MMKNQITILSMAVITILLLNAYTNGAPSSGATGSPGDNKKTCAQSGCHPGPVTAFNQMIYIDMPCSGWEPGKTYDVIFSVIDVSATKFGFQLTSEDSSGAKKGTFVKTATTQILKGGSYITHVSSSTGGPIRQYWKFKWIAPSKGAGTITFYGAANASDNSGTAAGDIISRSQRSKRENTNSTTFVSASIVNSIKLYPNPVKSNLYVNNALDGVFKIFDLSGYSHLVGELEKGNNQVNLTFLKDGVYFFYSKDNGLMRRIIKE